MATMQNIGPSIYHARPNSERLWLRQRTGPFALRPPFHGLAASRGGLRKQTRRIIILFDLLRYLTDVRETTRQGLTPLS